MPSARLTLREEDVVRLALEFLYNRQLHISQLSLERETGVINGNYSDDVLFLRQLILDGQWDDVLEFIQPLEALKAFNMKKFSYTILKHKYIELLCIKSEANIQGNSVDNAVEEVVSVLNELEKYSASKEEYSTMCLLLTLPRLSDHLQYKDWNPSNARVQCFREVYPLVAEFLLGDRKPVDGNVNCSAQNDRLIQLIIKGILYESCVNYCQAKATGSTDTQANDMNFSKLLDGSIGFSDSDLSLLSWLQSVPPETFSVPFEQRTLNVDVERLERPSLETSWTEHMLVTPIKPKTFPHSAMPFTRPRSAADIMSRSLMLPMGDGLPFGLTQNNNLSTSSKMMALSTGDIGLNRPMSRSSFASFHLTGLKNSRNMNTSVDRLFENDGEVFLSNSYGDFQQHMPSIQEQSSTPKSNVNTLPSFPKNPNLDRKSNTSTPEPKDRDSPASVGTEMTPRGDFFDNRTVLPNVVFTSRGASNADTGAVPQSADQNYSGELVREFHRTKQKLQETLVQREKERDELIRQINSENQKLTGESKQSGSGTNLNNPGVSLSNGNLTSRAKPPASKSLNGTGMSNFRGSLEDNTIRQSIGDQPLPHTPSRGSPRQDLDNSIDNQRPKFVAVTTLEDVQAVRCAEFHPGGQLYAVGSNSKTLRICAHPKLSDLREDHETYQPTVLFKRTKHHKGSIYCLAWSPVGDLMATGSNDKTVKLMRFNSETSNLEGDEIELTMHDGTIRDLCFLEDQSNKSSLLISGGAGDCKIYVTDCATGTPFQALSGHTGHILSLYTWGGAMFVSGSHDKTVRFWDLRTRGCVNVVTPITVPGSRQGSPVSTLCVDPSGRLLVSGHEDSSCVLYDIRGGRNVQCFKPHSADVRSIRFSPSAYYLLSAGYDNKLVLTDLQGDLTLPLPSVVVAQHQDKVISGRWHPAEFSFLSTSADKTSTLWALPPV
ncbi:WD repeat-containing protein 47 [Diorhabda carinulata]|uniref:WD repeat-containing protein 47 n=2 Tax=Diorhabda TaxID=217246 RepID=UPI0024E17D78|nr:WD repeat-containing protein 47 isoform X1 [Diorhabda sublineata]XP_057663049.1 WD repeat-containing protein 47 [Diorhabda carinulata]